jgi:hypothetical protein
LSDPLGPTLESIAPRKAQDQMHKREASRQSSLRAAMSEQLKRLIENLALPVPELSPNKLGEGEFLSAYIKILLRKQEVDCLLHRFKTIEGDFNGMRFPGRFIF